LPDAPVPLRFGTWIGGDADGNPNAGADTIAEALERARRLLLARYRDEVRGLAAALGVSSRLTPVSDELLASIDAGELAFPEIAAALRPESRRAVPPQAVADVAAPRRRPLREPGRVSPRIAVLDRSLRANRGARIADGELAALRRRVELFGFHLAKLDLRLHANELAEGSERAPRCSPPRPRRARGTASPRSTR
jgi:Phosphoenolpyruvate carboxylase